jgi:hypothetical protein
MAIALGHRWLMRSNSQKYNGLDALFKPANQKLFWNSIQTFPTFVFRSRRDEKFETRFRINMKQEWYVVNKESSPDIILTALWWYEGLARPSVILLLHAGLFI